MASFEPEQPELENFARLAIKDEDRKQDIENTVQELINGSITNVNTYHNFTKQVDEQDVLIFLLTLLFKHFVEIMYNKSFEEHNAIINKTYLPVISAIDASKLSKQDALVLYSYFHAIPIKQRKEFDHLYDLNTKTVTKDKPIETALEEKITGLVDADVEYQVHSGKHKIVIFLHGSYTGAEDKEVIDYPFHSLEFLTCKGYILEYVTSSTIVSSICEERYDAYPFPIENGKIMMEPYLLMKMNKDRNHNIFLCKSNTNNNTEDGDPFEPQSIQLFDDIRNAFRDSNGNIEESYCLFGEGGNPTQCWKLSELRQILLDDSPNMNVDQFFRENRNNVGYSIDIKDIIRNIYQELTTKHPDIKPEDCTLVFASCRGTFNKENKSRQLKLRRTTRYTQTLKGGIKRSDKRSDKRSVKRSDKRSDKRTKRRNKKRTNKSRGQGHSNSESSSSSGINKTWRDVKPTLKVRIKTEHNKTKSYSLGSSEKREKIEALKKPRLKECTAELEFPCIFRGATIENKQELQEFFELNAHKSSKAVQKHLNDMRNKMFEEGTYARRIPPEFRLYSHNTGNVYDVRDYFQSK